MERFLDAPDVLWEEHLMIMSEDFVPLDKPTVLDGIPQPCHRNVVAWLHLFTGLHPGEIVFDEPAEFSGADRNSDSLPTAGIRLGNSLICHGAFIQFGSHRPVAAGDVRRLH